MPIVRRVRARRGLRSAIIAFVACAVPVAAPLVAAPLATAPLVAQAPAFTLEQVTSYPYSNQLVASGTGDRIVWAAYERGVRNLYAAQGPAFTPRKLTPYDRDDGQELTSVSISADGRRVVYVRGGEHGSNWERTVPVNPLSLPMQPKMQLWSVPFEGGSPALLADGGDDPQISPRGDVVAFTRGGQIWLVPIDGSEQARAIVGPRGSSGSVQWSPGGSRIAFVTSRDVHAMVGVYTNDSTPILWLAPSTSRDASPRWSPDGSRIAFVRRPGSGGPPTPILGRRHQPWAIWTADVASGAGRELWRAPATVRGNVAGTHGGTNLHWAAGDRIVFMTELDNWPHMYSISAAGGDAMLLTPGDYMAEYVSLTPDRRHLLFMGNAGRTPGDIDRRHLVRVPVDRAAPEVLTPGEGLEFAPVMTGAGTIAFISATARRPPVVSVMPASGGDIRLVGESLVPPDFPAAQLVVPRQVIFRSPDGLQIHGQLFERAGGPARKPAIVYVHGGPPRQMLLGWHYSDYYANAYAMNQYLASRGYVVLSVNFRLGIGYGQDFQRAANAGAQGASEYLDVKAAGEYLRALPQVDPARIGIYGGSYGGYLTALALARDSDLFAAGVDIHGVHDFTSDGGRRLGMGTWVYEPTDRDSAATIAWQSSPVSSVDTWRSPVLLIHGDDDRNVRFSETVDLVRRLDAAGVEYEEIVIPDETHHFMRYENQLRVNAAIAEFFDRKLRSGVARANGAR